MSRPGRASLAAWVLAIAAGLAVAVVPVAAADPAKPAPAAKDGWPDTPAGAAARRWVAAFSKGEEAMRGCLKEILAPASLATRGIEERMTTYRENRERFGTLTLASIEKSAPDEVEATLLAADLSKHRFVFKVDPAEPHLLLSVGRLEVQQVPGHGGLHH